MNELPEVPNTPENIPGTTSTEPASQDRKTAWYWAKRLLLCNPCYLLSAALLLFGIYRVSIEPAVFNQELSQLRFNFLSLEIYELLLVLAALFLARRQIWYDSTLLVALESMLVLLPFILISQAALIDQKVVWALSLVAGFAAVLRYGALKWRIPELNFPPRFLAASLAMLIVNVALPILYRTLHESKVGTRPDWGAAYHTNQAAWMLMLPVLCAGLNGLPARRIGTLPAQGRFLPLGFFGLGILATGVHLYCLGYVYDFALRPELVTPALWVLCWTSWRRLADIAPALAPIERKVFLFFPLLAPLLAGRQPGKEVFLVLMLLNSALYATVYARTGRDRVALHLAFVSLVALIGGWPQAGLTNLGMELSRSHCLVASLGVYVLIWLVLSRNPQIGMVASFVIFAGVLFLASDQPHRIPWATQLALAFMLGHSLRWSDTIYKRASTLRFLAAGAWVLHAFWWMHTSGQPWMSCAVAAPLLALYLGLRIFSGNWRLLIVPVSCLLVIVSGPGHALLVWGSAVPIGLLAVGASFLLLGLGTVAALTKERWSRNGPTAK